jgi:uncharacterized protein (DUF1330 family)
MSNPAFLVIKSYCPQLQLNAFLAALPAALAANGGSLLVAKPVHEVVAVEPGSLPAHALVISFADAAARDAAWPVIKGLMQKTGANSGKTPIVLAMAGVPDAGLGPDIPTKATVPVSPALLPGAFLLIEGTATDQARMDRYRDIILPMMVERSSYYLVFELGGSVKVLSGSWDQAIFAISRWPSMGHALDFWLSQRYQADAIPLRLDIGTFDVIGCMGHAA